MNSERSPEDLRLRTKRYALDIIKFTRKLPRDQVGFVITRQLLKSGTSPGAHYREACRAKSTADFISKLEGGLQELDESAYWLELVIEDGMLPVTEVEGLLKETNELISILVTVVRNAKGSR